MTITLQENFQYFVTKIFEYVFLMYCANGHQVIRPVLFIQLYMHLYYGALRVGWTQYPHVLRLNTEYPYSLTCKSRSPGICINRMIFEYWSCLYCILHALYSNSAMYSLYSNSTKPSFDWNEIRREVRSFLEWTACSATLYMYIRISTHNTLQKTM